MSHIYQNNTGVNIYPFLMIFKPLMQQNLGKYNRMRGKSNLEENKLKYNLGEGSLAKPKNENFNMIDQDQQMSESNKSQIVKEDQCEEKNNSRNISKVLKDFDQIFE